MKPWAYYNENDPFAAEWLLQLIARGLIADGDVDDRDMRKVEPNELRHYTQHHFFAGIGGWSLALRLAGWPDDKPVLTGSPPCQSFSVAGKQLGVKDPRHLAPHFLALVAALRPPVVFGEQVAAAVKKDMWLDDLLDALEGTGYATGAAVAPACWVGAPHLRQRIWFTGRLADTGNPRSQDDSPSGPGEGRTVGRASATGGLADAPSERRNATGSAREARDESEKIERLAGLRDAGRLADSGSQRQFEHSQRDSDPAQSGLEAPRGNDARGCDEVVGMADTTSGSDEDQREQPGGKLGFHSEDGSGLWSGDRGTRDAAHSGPAGPAHSGWETVDWLFCRDGKWRPAQPGLFPLAHGLPRGVVPSGDCSEPDVDATQEARVMRLRGYGNAIVPPQVAAQIIREVMKC